MQVDLQIWLKEFPSKGFYQVYEEALKGYLLRMGTIRRSWRLEKNEEDLK